MILALDLGTRTGWACRPQSTVISGVENFTPKPPTKTRAKAHPGQRFYDFQAWLYRQGHKYGDPTAIHYEAVARHTGTRAAHVYGGLLAIMLAYAHDLEIPVTGHAVGTIKKHATGSGRADKDDMCAAATVRVGREIEDDNEADAICILAISQETTL